jgi:hypothetical protein
MQPGGQQLSAQGRERQAARAHSAAHPQVLPQRPQRGQPVRCRAAHTCPRVGSFELFSQHAGRLRQQGLQPAQVVPVVVGLVSRAAGCPFRKLDPVSQARPRPCQARAPQAPGCQGRSRERAAMHRPAPAHAGPRSPGREWLAGPGRCRLQRRRPAHGCHSLQPAPPVPPWPAHGLRRPAPAIRRMRAPAG